MYLHPTVFHLGIIFLPAGGAAYGGGGRRAEAVLVPDYIGDLVEPQTGLQRHLPPPQGVLPALLHRPPPPVARVQLAFNVSKDEKGNIDMYSIYAPTCEYPEATSSSPASTPPMP